MPPAVSAGSAEQLGRDDPRRDCVDPDTERAAVDGCPSCQPDDGVLARRDTGRGRRRRGSAQSEAVVTIAPPTLWACELSERRAQSEEDPSHVHREHAVEILRRHVRKLDQLARDSGVEVVEIDSAEALECVGQYPRPPPPWRRPRQSRRGTAESSATRPARPASASTTATEAPSAARRRAVASPMPLPPPVTTATFPAALHSALRRPRPFELFGEDRHATAWCGCRSRGELEYLHDFARPSPRSRAR